jgi:hypothetical protein
VIAVNPNSIFKEKTNKEKKDENNLKIERVGES